MSFDFHTHARYIHIHIQIVFDFEIRSPSVNANALIEKWPVLKHAVFSELELDEKNQCTGYFGEEVGHFIALLKLLSTKPSFDEKVRALLIFTDVSVI